MPPEVTHEQADQLPAYVRELSVNVKELAQSNVLLSQKLTQTHTMLGGFISEQRGHNERVNRLIDNHTEQIGELKQFQARAETKMPNKLLDGDEINQRLEKNEKDISTIGKTIAKWGGVLGAIAFIAPIVVNVLLKIFFG